MGNTSIQWTEATYNPLRARLTDSITGEIRIGWHCEHASAGCTNCYAAQINKGFFQLGTKLPYTRPSREKVEVFLDEQVLQQPLRWKKPRMIFVCSMTDLFGEWHTDEMLLEVFDVIRQCEARENGHTFQLLTKRAERMFDFCSRLRFDATGRGYLYLTEGRRESGYAFTNHLKHCWMGVSVEDQKNADERIPWLLKTPAAVRWVSYEPALGPVSFSNWLPAHIGRSDHFAEDTNGPAIDWIVFGLESGPNARPGDVQWARDTISQCRAAGIPPFIKQFGAVPMMREDEWRAAPMTRMLSASNKNRVPEGFVPLYFYDKKGGDIEAWDEDLRVREMPRIAR